MATLPVYRNQSGVTRLNGVNVGRVTNVQNVGIGNGMQALGKAIQEVSVKWQEAQDSAEALDGKNKLTEQTNALLQEAQTWSEYNSPKDIKHKQEEMQSRLSAIMENVTNGFTNQKNAERFSKEYELTQAVNMQRLNGLFRQKFIDDNAANLIKSEDRNRRSFIETGNIGFKESYKADLQNSFAAGFIDKETVAKAELETDKWNFARASFVLDNDPQAALREADNFGLNAADKKRLIGAADAKIKQMQYQDGLNKLVEQGTEGNRLFNKYIDGSLTLDDIQNNDKISDNEKKALMRLGGFSEKSGKGGGLTLNFGGGKKKNVSEAEALASRLDLEQKIKETISGDNTKYLPRKKGIEDLLSLRDDVYDALEKGYLTREQAFSYMNNVIGLSVKEAKKDYQKTKNSKNPYILAMSDVDKKLNAMGVSSDMTRANVHNLLIEAMTQQINENNPDGLSWDALDAKSRESILNSSVEYAIRNVPNVNEANTMFSMYLPSDYRQAAQESFIGQWKKENTPQQNIELAKQVISEQNVKILAQTDLSIANVQYEFTEEDKAFLSERGDTVNDVVETAQIYGLSVKQVLEQMKRKK